MLLSVQNLKVHVAAAQRGRYALNTIALTRRGSVSTDGLLVLFVPFPTAKPADAPVIDGVKADAPPPQTPFLLRTEDAARAAGMVGGKGKRGYAPAVTELVQAEVKGDKVVLGATDLSSPQVMTVSQADGVFPDIGAVLPDFDKAMTITLDLGNTLRALKALKAASQSDTVTLRIVNDQTGINYSTPDGVAVFQMPITVEKPEDHCPDKLAVLKSESNTAAAPAGTSEPGPTSAEPAATPSPEPDTSVGSPGDVADIPDDEDSDDFVDDNGYYEDDGPPIESEMEDAAEVMAKAMEATPEQAAAAGVAAPHIAQAGSIAAASPAPAMPMPSPEVSVAPAAVPVSAPVPVPATAVTAVTPEPVAVAAGV